MLKKIILLIVISCFTGGAAFCATNETLQNRINESALVLDEIMKMPEQGIPDNLLKNCEAIGIFPSTVSGAFIIGGRYGQGVVVARDPKTRKWGAPAFFTIGGASLGWQIGGQATDLIFVINSKRGLVGLMQDKFTLGGDAAVAAGPIGRKAEASTDILLKSGIFSYSRSKGLFAGVALQGAMIAPNKEDDKLLYGNDITTDMIFNGKVKPTAESKELIETLNKYAR
ncbi:MAG: lipid-binding SYLF domain-containing protein [Candidatus Omnitrophica bacterium]|nr:lipid-binding SYLF domain-containing protein [Candidatus Omnitrophota bacterium]